MLEAYSYLIIDSLEEDFNSYLHRDIRVDLQWERNTFCIKHVKYSAKKEQFFFFIGPVKCFD